MWKSDPSAVYEEDFPLSYLSLPPLMNQYPQFWQSTLGTQRFDEPVSNMTVNSWGGVPIFRVPKYCALL